MNNQNVLALDLATKTGWAVRLRDGSIEHGVFNTAPPKGSHSGQRFINFRTHLQALIEKYDAHVVVYEDVRNHVGVTAAHIHGGLKAITFMVCAYQNIELRYHGVGQIKKHWTGKGNAKKDEMIAEAVKRGYKPQDDNVADALAILGLAFNDYGVVI